MLKPDFPKSIECAMPAAHRFVALIPSEAITGVSPMWQATRITLFPFPWSAL
jgi:hypothetical protein